MAIDFDKYIFSTGTHYISNSGKDENGGTKGGKAGDQGGEWTLRKWYSRPWTVVLRYPNQAVALTIAKLAIAAALNDKIGYDQSQRTTYWKQLKAADYDASKITVACEDDCTAGVSANVRAAGYVHGIKALQDIPICTSRDMKKEFVKAGFKALTDKKYLTGGNYLLPGDILLYEDHHAATNITCGSKVRNDWHPEGAPVPTPYPQEDDILPHVIITGDSVNIRKGPSTDYGSLGTCNKNKKLKYFGYTYSNGWNLVEYNKQTGWVSGKYSKVEE